jgi:tRNA A37 threonylcarbamoyladenosine biosynthesis protein TsaE/RNA processing factor Prp31
MVLLFRHSYERRAEKAAEGGAKVVVVGPPGAGKTTFIKQFLESRGVVAAEEVAGLAPEAEEARGEGLRERALRLLKRLAEGDYVPRNRVEKELAGIRGATLLKAFDKLPRSFVEHLRKRYGGWSLYLFYIPPEVEEEREAAEELLKIAERVGVEFRWFGLRYVPPGVVAMLKEGGGGYVEEQLRLYRRILEEFDAAGGRLAKLTRLGRSVAEKTGESLLERFAEAAEELAKVLLPLLPGGAAAGAVLGVASYLLAGGGEWSRWMRLLADWSRLDSRLKDLAAAHIALELGVGKEEVRSVLDSLSNKELEKLEERVEELYDRLEELWDEVIAQRLAKYGDVYTRRRAEELRVTYHKVVDAGVEYRLVTAGGFAEAAEEVERLLVKKSFVVVKGSRGIGKSTLAAYVAYDMLKKGDVDYVVKVKSPVDVSEVDVFKALGRRALLFFDIYPREVYLEQFDPRRPLEELYGSVEVLLSLAALAERSREVGAGLYVLAAVNDKALEEAHRGKVVREWLKGASFYVPRLNTPEFLAGVLKSYACPNENDCCLGKVDIERLVSLISSHDAYTLVAKYAGLWLRERGCDAGDVERAVEEAKKEPKLFFAHYIWHVLLRGSGDLAMQAAVPLLLHAVFGPVPVGVTYITKAADEGGRWRLSTPEGLEGADLRSLKKEALEPIAHWLAQLHEDLVEEALEDLAGLHREEDREPYKETLSDLIDALDRARDQVLKEGGEILTELGIPKEALKVYNKVLAELDVPEEGLELVVSLLAFVVRRLAAVFKSGESRRCWRRVALIAGYALAGHIVLPKKERVPEDVIEVLGDALRPCAVDAYLTIDGKIPTLSIHVVRFPYYVEALYARDLPQIRRIRVRLGVLSPLADAETIDAAKKTAEGLLARWRRRGFSLTETLYALGLAAMAARSEVDGETAGLLLYAASFAVQEVAQPAAVVPVLAALRPLGDKAPHRYVDALAAASELRTIDPETAQYIYDALQRHKDRILEAERRWPLVEAVSAYSNLLRKYSEHIRDRREDAVVDMCRLYGEVRKRSAAASDRGLSAQRLLDAVARAYVLAAALRHDVLAPLVQRHCGLGDLEKEVKEVMGVLDTAAAHPDESKKIVESDVDFAEWVTAWSPTGDAGGVVEDLRGWFTYVLADYKLDHALDERGELDAERLKEAAEEFEKAAEIRKKLKQWDNYLVDRGRALRARVLAARSWDELFERAKGFQELWEEAEKHREVTARYLETAAVKLGECLVYLAASGDRKKPEDLLKERRWLLDYVPEVSVATRLMLRLFGVGEGARQEEAVKTFIQEFDREFLPALSVLSSIAQFDQVLVKCLHLDLNEAVTCKDALLAVRGVKLVVDFLKGWVFTHILDILGRSEEDRLKTAQKIGELLKGVDGKSLVEVLAPKSSQARLVFMLLAAVEGRADAVRLHGLWGSARFKEPLPRRLFRAVYESCSDLNSEGCRMALLKLYYHHF